MVVDIEKVIIKERIRKDYGDIEELAKDISENGLINPPVVNNKFELLAGERRLRACKSLGWKQIEIHMMDTRDAEHELNVEISENDVRKGFTKSERVDYVRRLMRIEAAKARERQEAGVRLKSDEGSRADDVTAAQFGIGRDTMRKELAIVNNKELLDPSDFADWDEGKLSTNKAYKKIKEKLSELNTQLAEKDSQLAEKDRHIAELESREPEVKVMEKKVYPPDYKEAIEKIKIHEQERKQWDKKLQDSYQERNRLMDMVDELQHATQEGIESGNLSENVFYFCTLANNFVGNVGGLVWLTERIGDMSEHEKELFLKAAHALRDFSAAFEQNLERSVEGGKTGINTGISLLTD